MSTADVLKCVNCGFIGASVWTGSAGPYCGTCANRASGGAISVTVPADAPVCSHGQLRRACDLCERDETIATLRAEVAGIRKIGVEAREAELGAYRRAEAAEFRAAALEAGLAAARETAIRECIGALRGSRDDCMCFEKNVCNLEALLAPAQATPCRDCRGTGQLPCNTVMCKDKPSHPCPTCAPRAEVQAELARRGIDVTEATKNVLAAVAKLRAQTTPARGFAIGCPHEPCCEQDRCPDPRNPLPASSTPAEPACNAARSASERRCVRPSGHDGRHADATGERWEQVAEPEPMPFEMDTMEHEDVTQGNPQPSPGSVDPGNAGASSELSNASPASSAEPERCSECGGSGNDPSVDHEGHGTKPCPTCRGLGLRVPTNTRPPDDQPEPDVCGDCGGCGLICVSNDGHSEGRCDPRPCPRCSGARR